MKSREILEQVRRMILAHAGDDPDKWWYAKNIAVVLAVTITTSVVSVARCAR